MLRDLSQTYGFLSSHEIHKSIHLGFIGGHREDVLGGLVSPLPASTCHDDVGTLKCCQQRKGGRDKWLQA